MHSLRCNFLVNRPNLGGCLHNLKVLLLGYAREVQQTECQDDGDVRLAGGADDC